MLELLILAGYFIINHINEVVIAVLLLCIVKYWYSFFTKRNKKKQDPLEPVINESITWDTVTNRIKKLDGRDFEELCAWVFKKSGRYRTVELTPAKQDGGKDIILDGSIYVECKRYQDKTEDFEQYMIGREICQKLLGVMIADGIYKGIILTTGNVHQNAWDFLEKIKEKEYKIIIMQLPEFMEMVKKIDVIEVYNFIAGSNNFINSLVAELERAD